MRWNSIAEKLGGFSAILLLMWKQLQGCSHWALGALFLLGSAISVVGCNPAVPTHCQAYSRAEAVFVGKLLKVEKIDNVSIPQIFVHFQVEKIYKGTADKIEVVRFGAGDCDPRFDEIGALYFVYKDPFVLLSGIANLTRKYFNGMQDEKDAASLSAEKPIYTVSGQILGIDGGEAKGLRVEVRSGSRTYRLNPDENGLFKQVLKETGEILVRIELPYDARVLTKILREEWASEGNVINYTLSFTPNECDFRQITVSRIK